MVVLVVITEPSATRDASLKQGEDVGARELSVAPLQWLGEAMRVQLVDLLLELVVSGDGADRVAEEVAANPHVRVEDGRRDDELLPEPVEGASDKGARCLTDHE